MSAARRLSLITMLMTCAVLAFAASTARAQTGWEPSPHAPVLAPPTDDLTPPAGLSVSYEPASLGIQLQFGMSLTTFRWVEMAMGRVGFRQPAVGMASAAVTRSMWWRKQF